MSLVNRLGQRYGRLLVIAYAGSQRRGAKSVRSFWTCVCDCGRVFDTRGASLASGNIRSCGCLFKEQLRNRNLTHGKTHSPEHKAWLAMISRCYYGKDSGYLRYGGRGIVVCERWRDSFQAFIDDMGLKPSPKHTLDRIDNDRGYEPGNVRWATQTEQANNRRNNRWIEWRGERRTLAEWGRVIGLPAYVIQLRLRRGWSLDKTMTEPRHVNKYR